MNDMNDSLNSVSTCLKVVDTHRDKAAARTAMAVLLAELNSDKVRMGSRSITVAQLCDHFEQRELAKDNYVAQLLDQEDLPSVFDPLGSSLLAAIRTS